MAIEIHEAVALAVKYHKNDKDLNGGPNLLHILRVGSSEAYLEYEPEFARKLIVAGFLHDLREDHPESHDELERLLDGNDDDTIYIAVEILTRQSASVPDRETHAEYIERICKSEGEAGKIARIVKNIDLVDNLFRSPSKSSLFKRYNEASSMIGQAILAHDEWPKRKENNGTP